MLYFLRYGYYKRLKQQKMSLSLTQGHHSRSLTFVPFDRPYIISHL